VERVKAPKLPVIYLFIGSDVRVPPRRHLSPEGEKKKKKSLQIQKENKKNETAALTPTLRGR